MSGALAIDGAMIASEAKQRLDQRHMDWQAGALQGVLFRQPQGGVPDALQPWLQLFGAAPQSFQQNPPGAPPTAQATGLVGLYQVSISAQPGRLEIALSAAPSNSPTFATIVDVNAALVTLREYIHKLMGTLPYVRLAVILQLVKRVSDAREGNLEFGRNVKIVNVPEGASDVEFALNYRKRLTSAPDLEMNRLCRWSSVAQQLLQMQVRPDGVASAFTTVSETYISALSIDVNTVARTSPFTTGRPSLIFDELMDEAKQIMALGYDRLVSAN